MVCLTGSLVTVNGNDGSEARMKPAVSKPPAPGNGLTTGMQSCSVSALGGLSESVWLSETRPLLLGQRERVTSERYHDGGRAAVTTKTG